MNGKAKAYPDFFCFIVFVMADIINAYGFEFAMNFYILMC